MEHDKTLVTVSSAGIGLLVTLAAIQGVRSVFEIVSFVIGLIGFVVCINVALKLYRLNSTLIESELRSSELKPNLKTYDRLALASFMIGVVCLCTVGISAMIYRYFENKESRMANDEKQQVQSGVMLKKSLDGIQNLRPEPAKTPEPVAPAAPPANSQPASKQP
jgi:hypothetical protein